jgi:hypothetical protein
MAFGNGGEAGPTNTLYFTAGLTSHLTAHGGPFHGLFGSLTVASSRTSEPMTVSGGGVSNSHAAGTMSSHSTLSGNTGYGGGGIDNFGKQRIENVSSIIANTASDLGADVDDLGVLNLDSTSMISLVDGNSAHPIQ